MGKVMLDFNDVDIDETPHDMTVGATIEIIGNVDTYYKHDHYNYAEFFSPNDYKLIYFKTFLKGVYKITSIDSYLVPSGDYRKLYKLSKLSGTYIAKIFWYDIDKFKGNVL